MTTQGLMQTSSTTPVAASSLRLPCLVLVTLLVACGSPTRKGGDGDGETDALIDCMPDGQYRCTGSTYQTCHAGQWQTAVECASGCIDHLGCVQCPPSQNFCKDGDVWSCDEDGNPGAQVAACTGGNTCVGGGCVDACLDAASNRSYIGCEYWAVDLDNAIEVWGAVGQPVGQGLEITANYCSQVYRGSIANLPVCWGIQGGGPNAKLYAFGLCDPPATMGGVSTCPSGLTCSAQDVCVSNAQNSPFAIVVSNPHNRDVDVTVTGPGAQTVVRTVAAGTVASITPQSGGAIPDQSVDGSSKAARAYKVTSALPIIAYQFNPLDNVNVFSNDASLLIPRAALDTDYYAMTMPTLNRRSPAPGTNSYHGYVTVVAWSDGTQIEVTPTAPTNASATMSTLAANVPAMFTLDAHEVLQLQASGSGDLTGTHITSPNMISFGVFGGHEATAFGETTPPDTNHVRRCCADHLEEAMFPSATWGKSFAIARTQPRTNENDTLRILAQKPNTTVTFTPAPTSGNCPQGGNVGPPPLAPGQFCEVRIIGDTEIAATEPVLVGHYLQSSMWSTTTGQSSTIGTGDPSMAIAAPSEQFRKEYAFLVPAQYMQNYVSIAAPATGGVTLDGNPVALTTFPGGSTYRGVRVQVPAGAHKITCADGCGITVYGYSPGVSYMFAGGLDLKPIVIF